MFQGGCRLAKGGVRALKGVYEDQKGVYGDPCPKKRECCFDEDRDV